MMGVFVVLLCSFIYYWFYSNWCLLVWGIMMSMLSFFIMMNFEQTIFHVVMVGLGFDQMGAVLMVLSGYVWLLVVMVLSNGFSSVHCGLILMILMMLLIFFTTMKFVFFYVMYESILIPTFILIVGLGMQPERLWAGGYLLFYMLFSSLPLLVFLLTVLTSSGLMLLIYNLSCDTSSGFLVGLLGLSAFMVKMPLYLFHLWLPRAHVEAPISGSMILAGVLLKMGGYGLIRVFYNFYGGELGFFTFFISLGFLGCVIISLICLREVDIKKLIAYSSVVHMGLVLGGIYSNCYLGYYGAMVVMVGHGLCSSGLFYLANVIYVYLGSRSLLLISGLLLINPAFTMMMFMLISSNMSAPPSLNLLGEIGLFIGLICWSNLSTMLMVVVLFLSGVYSVFLYSTTCYGKSSHKNLIYIGVSLVEYLIGFLHWAPLNMLFLKGSLLG